jgi:uncharacterized protein YndB with AHSA1/START domain
MKSLWRDLSIPSPGIEGSLVPMKEINRTIQVDSDVEAVFALLADLRRRPDWVATSIQTFDLPIDPLARGQTFRQSMRVVGRPTETDWRVVDVVQPSRLAYEVMCPAGGYLAMTQNLISLGDGARIEIMVRYELPPNLLRGPLSKRYMERRIDREMAVSLYNLRDLVENP